jgi:hypothetical protein
MDWWHPEYPYPRENPRPSILPCPNEEWWFDLIVNCINSLCFLISSWNKYFHFVTFSAIQLMLRFIWKFNFLKIIYIIFSNWIKGMK